MKRLRVFFLAIVASPLLCSSPVFAQGPVLFFSDLTSGPNTGGESVGGFAGTYVTLYGNYFGASQGSSSVTLNGANCLRVVSWGAAWQWYQKIVVQLGTGCTSGNFLVTTAAGTSPPLPFTVRAGSIRYVSTSGNDSNAGTFASPWRTILQCRSIAAGDICYVGAGVVQSTLQAYEAALPIETGGTATAPKAIVGYPDASPRPKIGGTTNIGYGIRVPDVGATTDYWVFANLYVVSAGGNSAVMMLTSRDWRVVGNRIECPNFNAQQGCVTISRAEYMYFYGNELTNVGVSPASQKQSHALYYTTQAMHNWTGWNHIHDNFTCRAIQYHSSPYGNNAGLHNIDIHINDNVIHGDNCDGINLATADASTWPIDVYNNLIYNVGLRRPSDGPGNFACIANLGWNNSGGQQPNPSGTVNIYNNTLYNCGRTQPPENYPNYGAVGNGSSTMDMVLRNNIVYMTNGPYIESQYNLRISGTNNLWYGQGNGPTQTTGNINADPRFISAGADFHTQTGSPALNAGAAITGLVRDLDGRSRPQGASLDVGAYEYDAGAPPPPPPPTLLSVQPLP